VNLKTKHSEEKKKKKNTTFKSRLKPSSTSPQKKVLDVSPW